MSEEQLVFEVEELLRVSCTCRKCGTQHMFDLVKFSQHGVLPSMCSVCREEFVELGQMINAYRQFYEAVRRAQEKYTIRLHTKPEQRKDK